MKRAWRMLAPLLCLVLLCACQKEVETNRYQGYTLADTPLEGGEAVAEANAYALAVTPSGETTKLTFTFKTGSRMSGTVNESEAQGVPQYRAWIETAPARLMLQFDGLSYWDFERRDWEKSGLVLGYFRYALVNPLPLQTDAPLDGEAAEAAEEEPQPMESVYLCFQLAQDAAFQIQEQGGQLSVTLLPVVQEAQPEQEAEEAPWYLIGNGFRDYCEGTLLGAEQMTPTYTSSLDQVVLISQAYASDIEAELAKRQILEQNPSALESDWMAVQLGADGLPAFDETARQQAAFVEAVQRRNGQVAGAQVCLADGIFLSSVPRRLGGGILYSKRITEGIGAEAISYEELYILDSQDKEKRLLDYAFATVERAVFSPDGRKLAVLEREAERTNLYVVDVGTRDIITELTRAGFGDTVSALCWDSMGSMLFAVSGSGEMQVHAYDFNVPDETKRHTGVDKNGANEGYIGYCGGEVYFVQSEMEGDTIYEIKPEGGVRKAFCQGGAFALSPNNAYMAISGASSIAGGAGGEFLLRDMQTGQTQTITDDFAVYDFVWSQDGSILYYFENRLSGSVGEAGEEAAATQTPQPQDPYPYTLWAYQLESGESQPVCDLASTRIAASSWANRLYYTYLDEETMGEKVRATYWIDFQQTPEQSGA